MEINDILCFENKIVELKFKHFMGGIGKRIGRVEIDNDWLYIYKKGKTRCHYEGAFQIDNKNIHEILEIKEYNNENKFW